MKKLIYTLALSLIASMLTLSTANAAVVTVSKNFLDDAAVAAGVNTGGLDNYSGATTDVGGEVIANGDDALNLQLTINDSGDTGATFTALMTITGIRENPDGLPSPPPGILLSAGGHFLMNGSRPDPIAFARNNDQVTFEILNSSIVQTGGPAATASFVGFSRARVNQFHNVTAPATKGFTFGTTSEAGDGTSGNGNVDFAITGTGPGANIFDGTGSDRYRFFVLDADFLVTAAIPEPGSLALLGLGLAGLVCRCRRN